MSFICLWSPAAAQPESEISHQLTPSLLAVAPRVMIGSGGSVWADARGMSAEPLARNLIEVFHDAGVEQVRAALSLAPISAEVAARYGEGALIGIPPGAERDYLALYPIGVLEPSLSLASLLDGIGIETCGDLARLDHESVEVRFGAEGSRLWRLSRADDSRRIFTSIPRALPLASLEIGRASCRERV